MTEDRDRKPADLADVAEFAGSLKALCGHVDALGHLAMTVCGKCARRNHRNAMKGRR